MFLSSRKYDPGCSSRIRILIFYPSRIPDPGVKKAPDPDPQHWPNVVFCRLNFVVMLPDTCVSVMVYNLFNNIQEDNLQHLSYFTEYGR